MYCKQESKCIRLTLPLPLCLSLLLLLVYVAVDSHFHHAKLVFLNVPLYGILKFHHPSPGFPKLLKILMSATYLLLFVKQVYKKSQNCVTICEKTSLY